MLKLAFKTLPLLLLCACAGVQGGPPKAQDAQESVFKNIEYVPGGGERNKLDVYIPKNAPKPMPVILYIHGGAWVEGSKDGPNYARELLRYGYAVVIANYRYATQAPFPAQIEDCKAAVRWIRANARKYGFDPDRVGATGESAGGHLCSMLAVTGSTKKFDKGPNLDQRSEIQAGVSLFGAEDLSYDTLKKEIDEAKLPPDRAKWAMNCVTTFLGGDPARNPEKAKAASPASYVSAKAAPLLVIHGKKDDTVPYVQSVEFVDALKEAGADARLILVEGLGHSWGDALADGRAEEALAFLNARLKKARN